ASFDVLKMARPGLMLPLRAALAEAKKRNQPARRERVRIDQGSATREVDLVVVPLKNLQERCFLILFTGVESTSLAGSTDPAEATDPDAAAAPPRGAVEGPSPGRAARSRVTEQARRITELETDLAETRDYLQSIQQQYEGSNEDIQAASEELQSANEELQSLNEELETSKEELESSNEELTTVNEEMARRNDELGRLSSDLINVQTATGLVIVLLARDLTLRRFSTQAEKQFNLLSANVGRPIGQVRHRLQVPDLESLITEVIDTVSPAEREVQDLDGRWYSLSVRPYVALDNKVDGAVLVLLGIDALKHSEQVAARARDLADNITETVRESLLVLDAGLQIVRANGAFYRGFGVTPAATLGKSLFEINRSQLDVPMLRTALLEILPKNNTLEGFVVEHDFEGVGHRVLLLNARRVSDPHHGTELILLAIEDITEHELAGAAAARLAAIVASSEDAIVSKNLRGIIQTWNAAAELLFGYTAQEAIGQPAMMLLPAEHAAEELDILERIGRGEAIEHYETVRRRKDGSLFDAAVTISPVRDAAGRIIGAAKIARDITARKRTEAALRDTSRQKDKFLAMLAHELRNPLAPIRSALEIVRRVVDGAIDAELAPRSGPARPAMDMLDRQVNQLMRLVDDLLDANRISRGQIELRRQHVELSQLVGEVVEAARPAFDGRGQELTASWPPTPIYLAADPIRLAQALGNLLSNAGKFGGEGGR
ncbi:MAG: PAS domain S-box protein, partial [Burkholderiaceae bacterium]